MKPRSASARAIRCASKPVYPFTATTLDETVSPVEAALNFAVLQEAGVKAGETCAAATGCVKEFRRASFARVRVGLRILGRRTGAGRCGDR